MKPDWEDAPEWANWLAMDGDGYWEWYADEPEWEEDENIWYCAFGGSIVFERACDEPDESGIDWDHAFDTKEPRP